jgi:amino acid adenylation domain-containing protein
MATDQNTHPGKEPDRLGVNPLWQTLEEGFQHWARIQPDAIALSSNAQTVSYGQLDGAANRIAWRLREMGVSTESIVGVYCPRSIESVIAKLAILKAGGAYLPLDPTHPESRNSYILEEACAEVVLTDGPLPASFGRVRSLSIRDDSLPERTEQVDPVSGARNLAYVVYTSGSTGTPKGVMIEQAGVVNLAWWARKCWSLSPGTRTTWVGAPAFDVSAMEIWSGLLSGCRIEVLTETIHAPEELRSWLTNREVEVTVLVTQLGEGLMSLVPPRAGKLRLLVTGGERVRLRPAPDTAFSVINAYGPTEVTVLATAGFVSPTGTSLPSIGTPILNQRVYVLDPEQHPVPEGEPGEIYVSGVGLARGYVARPEETARRFLPNLVLRDGSKWYRTGDFGRWHAGELEFIGRQDDQVKIRGYRVELAEIERVLLLRPDISAAAAMLRGDRLVAYAVPTHGCQIDTGEASDRLAKELPSYMIPSAIVQLEAMPLSPNGKIDRKSLADMPLNTAAPVSDPPRNDLEAAVAELWKQTLNVDSVGIHDNFFDLGGHSLLATRLLARIRRRLNVEISVRALFDNPTVADLVEKSLRPRVAGKCEELE